VSLSGYYYECHDLINLTSTPADELAFVNVDGADAVGAELEVEAKFDMGLMARASYALQRTTNDDGEELTSSPRHLAKLNVTGPLYGDRLFAGLELQYQSGARTLRGGRTRDAVTVNLNLFSQKLAKGLELSGGIHNLLDAEIEYAGSEDHLQEVIVQDGRSFRVKLSYRF
jgi:iron complex outermembrane receptor protein